MHRRALLASLAGVLAAASPRSQALEPRALRFPADFGAHPAQRIEWWYVTGHLRAAPAQRLAAATDAPQFGFQITFFRSRTGIDPAHPSRFAASQLLFAHAALTDLAGGRLHHDQRVARRGFGIAEYDEADTRLRLRDWTLGRDGTPASSRYTAHLDAGAGFGWELTFTTTQPPLLQGDAGWSRKGTDPAQASLYYSQPQLSAAGRLRLDGRSLDVSGRAWLDHEWSDTLLDVEAVGWDWIGINLDDGSALTAFRLRRADGQALYAGGSWRRAGEPARAFPADAVRFTPQRHWTSPRSAARYPVQWRVDTPAGSFDVVSLLEDQELDSRASTGAIYWEGLSELRDARGQRIGLGYLEMTGYAAALKL